MSWKVALGGDGAILAALPQLLSSLEWTVTTEGDTFFLESDRLEPGDSEKDVRERAIDLVERLNGALRLERHLTKPLTVGAVYKPRDDGKHDIYVLAQAAIWTRTHATLRSPTPIPDWMRISDGDHLVAWALQILGEPTTWHGLYQLLDIVKEDCDNRRIPMSLASETAESVRLFTWTANNFRAIGKEARHARTWDPPERPMPIRKARLLIETIVRAWLQSK